MFRIRFAVTALPSPADGYPSSHEENGMIRAASIHTVSRLDTVSNFHGDAAGLGGGGSSATRPSEKFNVTAKKSFAARLAGVLVSLTIASTFVIGMQSKTAHAAYWTGSGHPGWVQAPQTEMYGNELTGGEFFFPARYAWRSNYYSTSTQVITVTYYLYKLNLGTRTWQLNNWAHTTAIVQVGQGAWMGQWAPPVEFEAVYHVEFMTQWKTTTGTPIGTSVADSRSTTDYGCAYQSICQVYPDDNVGADVQT
jgi:hypothetical protein